MPTRFLHSRSHHEMTAQSNSSSILEYASGSAVHTHDYFSWKRLVQGVPTCSTVLHLPGLNWLTWIVAGIQCHFLCPSNNGNRKGKFPPKVWEDRVRSPDHFPGYAGLSLMLGSPIEFQLLRCGDDWGPGMEGWSTSEISVHFQSTTQLTQYLLN